MQNRTIQDGNFLVLLKDNNTQVKSGREKSSKLNQEGIEMGLSSIPGCSWKPLALCTDPGELWRGSVNPARHLLKQDSHLPTRQYYPHQSGTSLSGSSWGPALLAALSQRHVCPRPLGRAWGIRLSLCSSACRDLLQTMGNHVLGILNSVNPTAHTEPFQQIFLITLAQAETGSALSCSQTERSNAFI